MRQLTLTLAPFAVLAAIPAQIPLEPSLGPFSTTGLGLIADGTNDLAHYRSETQDVVAFAPIPNNGPHYSITSIFASVLANPAAHADDIALDAISTGNDQAFVRFYATHARIEPRGPLHWNALFVSFRSGTVPTTGPRPMAARAALGGASADVYSWIMPGSTVLQGLQDQVFLDVPAERLGLPRNGEITALDIPMALLEQSSGANDPVFMPVRDRFFFSLTQTSANALAPFMPNIPTGQMSGATIFQTTWSGFDWSPIEVLATPSELGLANGPGTDDDEELDALAVNAVQYQTEVPIIFSVRTSPSHPQLEAMKVQNPGMPTRSITPPVELFDANGGSTQARFGNSDVDAICGIDPDQGDVSRWLGTPFSVPSDPPLILSTTQVRDANGLISVVVEVHLNSIGDPDAALPAGPIALQAALAPPNGPQWPWATAFTIPSWNGAGPARAVIPLNYAWQEIAKFRAIFMPSGLAPLTSSEIHTKL